MKQYFTSLELTPQGYVGTVFDPNTNQSVYKTQPYENQIDANKDVAEYLKNAEQPLHLTKDIPTNVIPTTPAPRKRPCCNR